MSYIWLLWQFALVILAVSASVPPRIKRDNNGTTSQFVTVQDGQFVINGSVFDFVGTNAYWLHALNTEEDIEHTLGNISEAGFKVVRTWAFNDVEVIPENGTWFQLMTNRTFSINNGTNGIAKLDAVVELAQKHGIYLLLSLTNNWSSIPGINQTQIMNMTTPRNTLSNDYGGMDFYVRNIGVNGQHDQFYLNQTVVDAFKNYTNQIVSRYVNHSSIFGWELANDPRCNSSLPSTAHCNTTVVTQWHSDLAKHIKTIDPNHLITSGNQGYFCAACPKLFPLSTTSQQDVGVGPAFDGTHGVDSEDIINIPEIGFGSFEVFPDQFKYGTLDPNLPPFNQTLNICTDWIRRHAGVARLFGKPISLTGLGLVTQDNAPSFTPFNNSVAPPALNGNGTLSIGFSDEQRGVAYRQWIQDGFGAGVQGIIQYQWSQDNLTVQQGSIISPLQNETTQSPNQDSSPVGTSPNDGYGILGQGKQDIINIIKQAANLSSPGPTSHSSGLKTSIPWAFPAVIAIMLIDHMIF